MPLTVLEQELNIALQEPRLSVLEIDENRLKLVIEQVESTTLVREDRVKVIEVNTGLMGPAGAPGANGADGAPGPAGPPGAGFNVGLLAARPAAPPEGTVYYSTDINKIAIYIV